MKEKEEPTSPLVTVPRCTNILFNHDSERLPLEEFVDFFSICIQHLERWIAKVFWYDGLCEVCIEWEEPLDCVECIIFFFLSGRFEQWNIQDKGMDPFFSSSGLFYSCDVNGDPPSFKYCTWKIFFSWTHPAREYDPRHYPIRPSTTFSLQTSTWSSPS